MNTQEKQIIFEPNACIIKELRILLWKLCNITRINMQHIITDIRGLGRRFLSASATNQTSTGLKKPPQFSIQTLQKNHSALSFFFILYYRVFQPEAGSTLLVYYIV
uniref:(northern house mosquito) hypothetical protein n=1 Tax=Culex pipiens TaxID=7175 RepID=A0A8D8AMZ3_CULPI